MKVSICCDFENVYLSSDLSTKLVEFTKLHLKSSLISARIYTNSSALNSPKLSLTSSLQQIGYKIVDVDCSLKNAVDNQIKSDLLDDIYSNDSPDTVILVSGDGDFTNCVKMLRDKGKYVVIFARQGNAKKNLKDVADEFHFIDDLPALVERKNQPQINDIHPQISYTEAVKYLMKAVQKALSQKKPTNYSYLDKLMRQISPNYQGVPSISTSDGKKFKNFGQFIDMVVKEGKVTRQNQHLFLVELNQIAA